MSRLEDRQVPGPLVEVLHVEHCPNFPAPVALVQRVVAELGVDAEVQTTMIGDQAAAERARFVGSPTIRVNGRDVDPDGELAAEYTTQCRLYWHDHRLAGYPKELLIREALLRAPAGSDAAGRRRRSPRPSLACLGICLCVGCDRGHSYGSIIGCLVRRRLADRACGSYAAGAGVWERPCR